MKPICPPSVINGDKFSVIEKIKLALVFSEQEERAIEFHNKAKFIEDHDDLLRLCFDYVTLGKESGIPYIYPKYFEEK